MATSALAAGANECRIWLFGFDLGPLAIYQECGYDEGETEDDRYKNRTKGHVFVAYSQCGVSALPFRFSGGLPTPFGRGSV